MFRGNVLAQRGIPLAIYSDRHPVFKFTGDIDRYPAGPTQLARAMEEMGIRQISDRSPQAKGRVERAAGTFQDRLVAEIRLAGAATNAAANEVISGFLPRFNERFGVRAEQDCPACRSLEQSVCLDRILCFKHHRKVSRDNTVKYNRRTPQLLPDGTRPTFAGMQVELQEDLDGRLLVQYQGETIPTQKAPQRPALLRETDAATPENSKLTRGTNGAGDRCDPRLERLETGEAPQIQGATAPDTHPSTEDPVGECAAGQAQRTFPQGNLSRTGHPQKHRPQVRLVRKPATQQDQKRNKDTTA